MARKPPYKTATDQSKKIHIALPDDLHKKVKVKCAYEDLSIQSYVEMLIREDMKSYRVTVGQEE